LSTLAIEHAVALAKAAGEKSVILLGASIDQQRLKAGLVDEIMIHLAPILIQVDGRLAPSTLHIIQGE
jgi:dihydrofolate reductase